MTLRALLATLVIASPVLAHDRWANGDPVPPWVKRACCGPEDAHQLTLDDVHATPKGWIVAGYHQAIPMGSELPSQDGHYWIFYRNYEDGSQSTVYCFFVPIPGI